MKNWDNKIDSYFRDIQQIPLLSREEEVRYARLSKQGNADARTRLIEANLRLVVKVAHSFSHNMISLEDLIAEGNIGLMKAVDRFDPERGFRFSTYAMNWITQAIRQAIIKQGRTVRLPAYVHEKLHQLSKAIAKLERKWNREPTVEEIAKEMGTDREHVNQWIKSGQHIISLNEHLDRNAASNERIDMIPDKRNKEPAELLTVRQIHDHVRICVASLDPRSEEIVSRRFGLESGDKETLEEIGRHFHITRERVRQLERCALRHIRSMLREDTKLAEAK